MCVCACMWGGVVILTWARGIAFFDSARVDPRPIQTHNSFPVSKMNTIWNKIIIQVYKDILTIKREKKNIFTTKKYWSKLPLIFIHESALMWIWYLEISYYNHMYNYNHNLLYMYIVALTNSILNIGLLHKPD